VLHDFRLPGDDAVFEAVNGVRHPLGQELFLLGSSRLVGAGLLIGTAVVLMLRLRGRRAFVAIVNVLLAVGLTDLFGSQIIKPLIGRQRPCFALPPSAVQILDHAANVGSMPSLHAANAFAGATVATLAMPRLGWGVFPIATFVAVSRVGVGVHWPSDVMAGALYGAVVGWGIVKLSQRVRKPGAEAPANPR
jgi:undecaprenyl-diphosphatase